MMPRWWCRWFHVKIHIIHVHAPSTEYGSKCSNHFTIQETT